MLIRQISGEKDPTWYGFLKPLSSQLWALVILTQLVIILCLNVVRRLKLRCLGRKSSDSRDDGHFAAQIVGIFFLQGQPKVRGRSLVIGLILADWLIN